MTARPGAGPGGTGGAGEAVVADEALVAALAARREPVVTTAVQDAIESASDAEALVRRVAEALVPAFADGCEIDVRGDDGIVRVVAGIDPERAGRREAAPLTGDDRTHPILAVLRGAPARLLDAAVAEDERLLGSRDDPNSARSLGITSALLAPVVAGGEVVGSIGLGRGPSGRRFVPDDLPVAVDLGRRLGLAWRNTALLDERASILASLHDALIVTDADGAVLEVNDRWVAMSGFDAASSVGAAMPHPWWPTADEHPEALAEVGVASLAALDGADVEQRVLLKRADGTFFPALMSVSTVVDRVTDTRRGLVVSIKDLTGWEGAQADLLALQRTTAALAAARSRADVAVAVLDEAMARLGAHAGAVCVLDDDGRRLRIVGHRGLDAEQAEAWREVPVDRPTPSAHAARDGAVVTVADRDALARTFPDLAEVWRDAGLAAVASAPVVWDGHPRGALTLYWRVPRRLGPGEVALLEAVAAQCGQALHRAAGYEVEHRTSQVLQSRMLSDVPVLHERATIVSRYRPASVDLAVGGDWYDVVHLGPDRFVVVVGDVVGSGIDAAAVMGQLRTALRGILAVEADPVAALEALDRVAAGIDGAPGATACFADIDLVAGRVRLSRAGHPPPVLVGAGGGARFVDAAADPPVGFARTGRRSHDVAFASGDVLLLYTDGLVERRGSLLNDRLDLLLSAASGARRGVLDHLVDDVVEVCAGDGPRRDDVAVLAVRDEPAGPDRFRALVAARARELAPMRRRLRTWLAGAGVPDDAVEGLVLATNEAMTNAVEHAYRTPSVVHGLVSVAATLAGGDAVVEVRDAGIWKARPSSTVRGRGLAIARRVVDAVEVHAGPSGTTAVLRVRTG